jgi:hypothetical protein
VEWNWQGKTEVLGEKPVPVPLSPPQIPHGLTRDRTRASAVRGRRLTAWAVARPQLFLYIYQITLKAYWLLYVPPGLTPNILQICPQSMFFIILTVNSNYFPIQHSPIAHSNGSSALCEVRNSLCRLQCKFILVYTGLKYCVVVVTEMYDIRTMFCER